MNTTGLDYRTLCTTPPTLKIKEGAREVVFTLISAMCNNESTLRFKKKDDEFTVSLLGQAFGNMQSKHDAIDMTWAADEGDWDSVIDMINTGTGRVGVVRSR